MKNGRSKRFYRSKRFWFVALIALVAGWTLQGPILSFVVRQILERGFEARGIAFRADTVQAGAFKPILVDGISMRPVDSARSGAVVRIEHLKILWNGPQRFLAGSRQWIRGVSINGINVVWDFRRSYVSPFRRAMPETVGLAGLLSPGGWWASNIEIQNGSAEILGENFRHVMNGFDLSLNSDSHGRFHLESLTLQAGKFNKVLGPMSAATTWDQGTVGFAGLDLVQGITLSDASLHLESMAGPFLSFSARVYGGALRGDLSLSDGPRGKVWDIAVIGSNINLEDFPALLNLTGKAKGTLLEGRFTFRGDAGRPVDAESSLRVLARDFRWNDRGWESLEIGASLIHRRLLISNFDLRQKENKVTMNGEISLADGWGKISESPFLANIRANIKELNSLAGLLDGPLGEASGQLTAEGSVSGRPGSLDGFLGVRAKNVIIHSLPVDQMALEILFRKKHVDLIRCEMSSGKDSLQAKGTVELASPHPYSAELKADLAEVAAYLRPFQNSGDGTASGGALGIRWNGKGMAGAHSGEFDMDLSHFKTSLTPAGLTGHFKGVYSPENLYFSELDLENGGTHLRTTATLSSTGLTLEGLELKGGAKPLLSGSVFLPLDVFSILRGADWRAAVLQGGDMYVRANTPSEIDLYDLSRLAGQDWPLAGSVKMQLEATGPLSQPDLDVLIRGRGVSFGAGEVPSSSIDINLNSKSGKAVLEGRVESEGMAPANLKAVFPLALSQSGEGALRWFDPQTPFEAELEMPRFDLALTRPLLPFLHSLQGEISGNVEIKNNDGNLEVKGQADVGRVRFGLDGLASGVEDLHGSLAISSEAVVFQNIEGIVGNGRFALNGKCVFQEPWNPFWDLSWRVDRVPIADRSVSQWLASGSLRATGNSDAGILSGEIGFGGSSVRGALALRPLLCEKSASIPDFASDALILSKIVPSPAWLLDVKINGESGVDLIGDKCQSLITADLRLQGTVVNPLPVGSISLKRVDAGGFFIDSGQLIFLPDQPWDPFLLVEGDGWFATQLIHAFAFGPLSECKWILSSPNDPGQTPQSLFLAVQNGWSVVGEDGMAPVDFFRYFDPASNREWIVSSRIEEESVWRNGIRFSESMNFSPGSGIFPIDSFRSGFEWKFKPIY